MNISEDQLKEINQVIDNSIKDKELIFSQSFKGMCHIYWKHRARTHQRETDKLRSFRHKLTIQMIEEKQKGYLPSSWYERKEIK
jgi:hypothetical protein